MAGRGWLLELPFRNEGLGVRVGGRGWRYGLWVGGGEGGEGLGVGFRL